VYPQLPTIAEAALNGCEAVTPFALFAPGGTPAAIVNRRVAAAGYLKRVATELSKRNLASDAVRAAADLMGQSSEIFRKLRYEGDLQTAGALLASIADKELQALAMMERGWEVVRILPAEPATTAISKVA
jgi:hypothetical protein